MSHSLNASISSLTHDLSNEADSCVIFQTRASYNRQFLTLITNALSVNVVYFAFQFILFWKIKNNKKIQKFVTSI